MARGAWATADGIRRRVTTLTGITFDEQGRMVVLETSDNPAPDPFNATQSAALIRVEHDGTHTVLASGGSLLNAGGVAYAGCGSYYVTTETAGSDGTGQLLKINVPDDQAKRYGCCAGADRS